MSLVTEYLAECGVVFAVIPHRRACTSIQEARELGVAAEEVLKTVALRSKASTCWPWCRPRGGWSCGGSARCWGTRRPGWPARPSCRPTSPAMSWALPPLGSLLGVPLLVDPEVLDHERVLFAAGTETESVQVTTAELFWDEPLAVLPLTRRDGRASQDPIPSVT